MGGGGVHNCIAGSWFQPARAMKAYEKMEVKLRLT
jgi:hypothetical protein